jgi:hypothetical protein
LHRPTPPHPTPPRPSAQIDEAGLPAAFLASIKRGVLASGEAMASVPNTLVALCLNQDGLKMVGRAAGPPAARWQADRLAGWLTD